MLNYQIFYFPGYTNFVTCDCAQENDRGMTSKNQIMKTSLIRILLLSVFILSGCSHDNGWYPLFNGRELPPYHHYLGRPDASVDVPGLKRDSLGNYLESMGWNDPLNVFSVDTLESEPVIRISGEIIGGLVLSDSLANYHLRLKFKWGNIKWDWMKGRPKDGGILYHQRKGGRQEYQIHEGDVGSYWSKKVSLDVPARWTDDIPGAIVKAKPYLTPLVSTLDDSMLIFDENAPLHHFDGIGGPKDWQIVIASPYNEKPAGEWNTLELICWKNHAVHIVNGKVNMVLLNSYYRQDGILRSLESGKLVLQSEGAELFFKDIEVKKLEHMPSVLKDFLRRAKEN